MHRASGGRTAEVPIALLYRIASEYENAGRLQAAEALCEYILVADPHEAGTLHLSGILAFRRKEPEVALARMELALRHGLDKPLYLRNLCEVYRSLGRLDDAVAAARQAAVLSPADPLCMHNLAVIHYHRLEMDACEQAARAALAIDPSLAGAHFELAEALLLQGRMEEGWEQYEWRFRVPGAAAPMPNTDRPHWNGTPLDTGRLLLVADQGFGDVIQFMRYIPWVRSLVGDVAIAASAETAPLIAQVAPDAKIFTHWHDCPDFSAFCTLSGLPRLHGTRLGSIPAPIPYLRADPAQIARWSARLDELVPPGYRRIGIVWAGRGTHNNDRNRSIELSALRPLADLDRVALIAVQKGDPVSQAGGWFARAPLISLGPEISDYADTMAILASLDLLITVDTSVAHLAGAMGRRAWIMLPFAPDWRWLLDRSDTPWYPTVRLFRNVIPGDWSGTIADVKRELSGTDLS